MSNHTGEKPFYCNICEANVWKFLNYCDVGFFHNGSFKTHMLKHTEENPFNCKMLEANVQKFLSY